MAALPLTGEQLNRLLAAVYGYGRGNRPDAVAAADAFGVKPATVRRWLHGSGTAPARIPAARLDALVAAHRPDAAVVRQEQLDRANAQAALAKIVPGRPRTVLPAWRDQGWLKPHVVAIVDYPLMGMAGVVTARDEPGEKLLRSAIAPGGQVAQQLLLTTRFAARLVAAEVLAEVSELRCVPPFAKGKDLRRTWLWIPLATVDLAAAAARAGQEGSKV